MASKQQLVSQVQQHQGGLNMRQSRFRPCMHECFVRMRTEATESLAQLAKHAVACKGGSKQVIGLRSGLLRRHCALELHAALAQEQAERQFAYIRGTVLRGVFLDLVSTLLSAQPV